VAPAAPIGAPEVPAPAGPADDLLARTTELLNSATALATSSDQGRTLSPSGLAISASAVLHSAEAVVRAALALTVQAPPVTVRAVQAAASPGSAPAAPAVTPTRASTPAFASVRVTDVPTAPPAATARVEGGPDSAPAQGGGRGANPGAGAPTDSAQVAAQPSAEPTAPPTASDVPEEAPTLPTGPGPTAAEPCDPNQPAGYATSAAAKFGWGKPNRVEDFNGRLDKSWGIYNGAGHGGKGRRTPDAVTVENGVLTITGDPQGNTAGMAWGDGQKYGRWEGRVKAPASDRSYNALLLLWPDAENWPVGGEVDFMEMSDHTRQSTDMFLHYGRSNSQLHGEVKIDATQWHNWAVEWTPDHVAVFVDGKQWWRTDKKEALPPGPMHLTIQLDWFPKSGAAVQTSHMYVDWVRQYPLNAAGDGTATEGMPVNAKPGLVRSALPAP
jgi:beta-glucanase (GH16 family)